MATLPPSRCRSKVRARSARSAARAVWPARSSASKACRVGPYQRRKNTTKSSAEGNRNVQVRSTDRVFGSAKDVKEMRLSAQQQWRHQPRRPRDMLVDHLEHLADEPV